MGPSFTQQGNHVPRVSRVIIRSCKSSYGLDSKSYYVLFHILLVLGAKISQDTKD